MFTTPMLTIPSLRNIKHGDKENEFTAYALINDMDGLNNADSVEEHIQAEVRLKDSKDRIRVRHTKRNDEDILESTIKLKIPSDDSIDNLIEHTVEIDEGYYTAMFYAASHYIHKTRYTYICRNLDISVKAPIGNFTKIKLPIVKYEVDVFYDIDGGINPYCKIDVELDDLQRYIADIDPDLELKIEIRLTHLPFKPTNILSSLDDDDQSQIDELYKRYLIPITK